MTEREEFETDAKPYGFDLSLTSCPCCTYSDEATEHRFKGWQAAKESSRKELEAAKQRIAELETFPMKYRRMEFNAQLQQQVEALEKKLAEQQAILHNYVDPEIMMLASGDVFGFKELTKLLAAVRAEGFEEGKQVGRDGVMKVPDGWQLVPKEPTAGMCQASRDMAGMTSPTPAGRREFISIAYHAMLAAAPQPPRSE